MYSLFHLLGLHKVMKYTTFRLSIYTKEYSHPTLKKIKSKDLLSLFCQSGYNPVEAKIIYTSTHITTIIMIRLTCTLLSI